MSKLMNQTGIYKITNLVNNKFYLGSTLSSFRKRKARHMFDLRNNKHHSNKLQNSYNKHGEINFSFEILEVCDKELCLIKEQEYIDLYKPHIVGYNINSIAANCTGRICSQKTKDQISSKLKGIKFSCRMSKEDLILKGLKHRKIIYQYDLNNNFIKEWSGMCEIVKELKITQGNISSCCSGRRNKTGNYKFSFIKL